MRFGTCPECNEYKYLKKDIGICPTCEDDGKSDLNDLLERASVTPEEIIDKLNK